MRIGIDARMLGSGFGLARYVQQLVKHLEKVDLKNQYILFMRQANWDEFEPANPNFKKVPADIPWYSWAEQIKLPGLIKKQKIDLMHFPHWNVPLLYSGKFIVTIHDLIMYHFPRAEASTLGPFTYWIKDRLHRLIINNAAHNAKNIITTSKFTKEDLCKNLNIDEKKIVITYQAPFPKNIEPTIINIRSFFADRGIDKNYVLYVGAAYPHKNLENLIKAWQIFQKSYDDYQLVLIGRDDFFYRRLQAQTNKAQVKNIIFAGFAPDNDLEAIYHHASLYIFPSLYEGFGLPPLEAMAYNVPVASSDRSCLPEILQDAAYYFNPEKPQEISDAMQHLLIDKNLRQRLIERGQKLCTRYSWDQLAQKTLDIYQNYQY